MTSPRIAVLRIAFQALTAKVEVEDAGEGWSAFEGVDGTRLEVCPRGSALLVRFDGAVGELAACFGELWTLHAESRGVAVHEQAPEGDDYDSLVAGASWEGGLLAQAAVTLGGGQRAEAGRDGQGEPFEAIANKLMSALAKRSSRKVLAVRLAAETGDKDLGDVLDAMEAEDDEGVDALIAGLEGRFAVGAKRQEMAELIRRALTSEDEDEEGEDAEGD